MKYQKQLLTLLIAMAFTAQAQDTTKTSSKVPERRNELGVSITVPLVIALGASENSERYTNITYRHFLSNRHVIKSFFGVSTIVDNGSNFNNSNQKISATSTATIYAMNIRSTPSNFQIGLGYEYIMGHKKLKHVIGADIYYNNKFDKEEHYYYKEFDSTDTKGVTTKRYSILDTGKYVNARNYDKIGINLSYTLRYEFSKKWLVTVSTIMTNKFYWNKKSNGSRSKDYEMNFVGLISDISIFYRFK